MDVTSWALREWWLPPLPADCWHEAVLASGFEGVLSLSLNLPALRGGNHLIPYHSSSSPPFPFVPLK